MAQSAKMLPCHHAMGALFGKPYRSCHGRFLSLQARSSLLDNRTGALDPGNWVFSPEWWGTQGRGWGRNPGTTVFEQSSHKGNGLVSVTAHPASSSGLEDWPDLSKLLQGRQVTNCEWRVLRFNHETRQSVAKVVVVEGEKHEEPYLMQIPSCLAFEYLKSMVTVGMSSINCAGLDLELVAQGKSKMRCLCIGLGGGSLPLFLANKLQGCCVEVVEIDKTVISAATECMGFPRTTFELLQQSDHGLSLSESSSSMQEGLDVQAHSYTKSFNGSSSTASSLWGELPDRIVGVEADGIAYVCNLLNGMGLKGQHYDLVFIDAFDGKDEVPSSFWNRGGPFLTALCDLLNPHHGTAVVNLHTDSPPPSLLERIRGDFGPGFDPNLPGGKQLQEITEVYRDELLRCWSRRRPDALGGVAFTVAVPRQQNICLVVSRGISGMKASIVKNLTSAACYLERVLDIPFPMSKRVSRGFQLVP